MLSFSLSHKNIYTNRWGPCNQHRSRSVCTKSDENLFAIKSNKHSIRFEKTVGTKKQLYVMQFDRYCNYFKQCHLVSVILHGNCWYLALTLFHIQNLQQTPLNTHILSHAKALIKLHNIERYDNLPRMNQRHHIYKLSHILITTKTCLCMRSKLCKTKK